MPTYDYKCSFCDNVFESVQTIDNRNIPCTLPCPSCEEERVERYINTVPALAHPTWTNRLDSDFKDTMKMIKKASGKKNTIPDY